MSDCIFCKISQKEIPADIVFEDKDTIAFLDHDPVAIGHTLVIPKEHAINLRDASEESMIAMWRTVRQIAPDVADAVDSDGFNLAMNNGENAGQVVNHPHMHIIPRQSDFIHKRRASIERPAESIKNDAEKIRLKIA